MEKLYGNKKNTILLLSFSAFLGILFNILFYQYRFGINYPIYLILILAMTYWALTFREDFNKINYLFMSVAMMLISANFFFSKNDILLLLDFVSVPVLYVLTVILSLKKDDPVGIAFFSQAFIPITNMDKFVRCGAGLMRTAKEGKKRVLGKIFLGMLFAALALIVILPLMLSGDEAFSVLFNKFIDIEITIDTVVQTFIFVLVTLYSFGFIYFVFHKKKEKGTITDELKSQLSEKDPNTFAYTLLTFLIVIGIVFLSFALVQILYLFAKINANLPSNFSYAEYARSGFFQVWVLTVINAVIILSGERISRAITLVKAKTFHIIFSAYVLINFAITASAFYKMMMYENAYGLTRSRLLVFIILILQTMILLMLMYKIWIRSFRFFTVSLILTLVFFIGVNYINIDAIVARRNLARFEATQQLDVDYLFYFLSDDALPILYDYAVENFGYAELHYFPDPKHDNYENESDYIKADYVAKLFDSLHANRITYRGLNWREYNLVDSRNFNMQQ